MTNEELANRIYEQCSRTSHKAEKYADRYWKLFHHMQTKQNRLLYSYRFKQSEELLDDEHQVAQHAIRIENLISTMFSNGAIFCKYHQFDDLITTLATKAIIDQLVNRKFHHENSRFNRK